MTRLPAALLVLSLAATALACSPPTAPAPTAPASASASALASTPAPAASSSAPAASSSAVASSAPPCPTLAAKPAQPGKAPEAARKACEKAAEAAKGRAKKVGDEAFDWLSSHWPGITRCTEDSAGAWLLDLDAFQSKDERFSGKYVLKRFAADGKVTVTGLKEAFGQLDESARGGAQVVASIDLDGDGQYEALLERSGYHGGGEDAWQDRKLLRLKGKEMVEVPLPVEKKQPRSILEVTDIDGDGRLDLIIDSPFAAPIPCTLDGEARGPRLLLHNTPSGLSISDEVAQQFARVECAGHTPEQLFFKTPPQGDPRESASRTAMAVGCARLGGLSADETMARLKKVAPEAEKDCSLSSQTLRGAAETKAPLTVPRLVCSVRP